MNVLLPDGRVVAPSRRQSTEDVWSDESEIVEVSDPHYPVAARTAVPFAEIPERRRRTLERRHGPLPANR